MKTPPLIDRLVNQLARLPGVGAKTAQRFAFHLLRAPPEQALNLAKILEEARRGVRFCTLCFGYAEAERCALCSDPQRDTARICVVEQPQDVFVLERMGAFQGVYHVLMGSISPLDGIGPEQLKIRELLLRLEQQPASEIILATSSSLQGEATALHLARRLQAHADSITRLARGMPAGSHLEYADELTLNQAFQGRQSVTNSGGN